MSVYLCIYLVYLKDHDTHANLTISIRNMAMLLTELMVHGIESSGSSGGCGSREPANGYTRPPLSDSPAEASGSPHQNQACVQRFREGFALRFGGLSFSVPLSLSPSLSLSRSLSLSLSLDLWSYLGQATSVNANAPCLIEAQLLSSSRWCVLLTTSVCLLISLPKKPQLHSPNQNQNPGV